MLLAAAVDLGGAAFRLLTDDLDGLNSNLDDVDEVEILSSPNTTLKWRVGLGRVPRELSQKRSTARKYAL